MDPLTSGEHRGATDRSVQGPTEIRAHVALVGVQLMFATLPIAAKYVLSVLPPSGLVLFRVVGGAAVLLALAHLRRGQTLPPARDLGRLALYGLLGVALNQLLYLEGLSRSTAINAQVITTTIPAFTLMFGALLGVDRATPVRVIGITLAAGGALYLVGLDRVRFTPEQTLGNALVAANSLSYSLYLVLSKPILKRYDSMTVIAWVFFFGTLFVAPFGGTSLAASGAVQQMTWGTWALVAYIVAIPTVGSYWLNTWALNRSAPSVVATYVYLQPVLTAVLAVLLLGETIGMRTVIGAALIFAGVALSGR